MKNLQRAAATFFSIYAFAISGVDAQPENIPLPSQPLIARPPAICAWAVNYSYSKAVGEKAKPRLGAPNMTSADRINTITYNKNGELYHQTTLYTSGAKSENWSNSGIQLFKSVRSTEFVRIAPDHPSYVEYKNTDFDDLSWIGMDNYVGAKVQDKRKVYIFESKNIDRRPTNPETVELKLLAKTFTNTVTEPGTSPENQEKAAKQANEQYLKAKFGNSVAHVAIDVETHFPIEYNDGTTIRAYNFIVPPPPMALPPEVSQEFQRIKNQTNANFAPPPP